jgi:putative transposase
VKKMCHVLDVSPSGYCRLRKVPLSPRRIENERLKIGITDLFVRHNGMVGSPIITADLHDAPEFSTVSRPRVARLMREMGLKPHREEVGNHGFKTQRARGAQPA